MTNSLGSYARSAALGGIAGMRTFVPAFALQRGNRNLASGGLAIAALGELIGDKLPMTPSRLARPALMARLTSGAAAGRTLARRNGASGVLGAIAGGAGAVAFANGCYHLRRAIVARTKLPDPVVALLEDAIAISAAFALTKKSG